MTVIFAGLCTVDVVQRVNELPEPGQKVQSNSVEVAAGGPATNAAVTAVALGGEAKLATVLGAHPLAGLIRADLATHGVSIVDMAPSTRLPPSVSAVSVRESDGERTVVSNNAGGRAGLTFGDLAVGHIPKLFEDHRVTAVLVDGHHPELALAVARIASARGVPVVLDAGSWKPVLDDLLPMIEVCACAERFRVPDGTASLHQRGVPTVITTRGANPVHWSTKDGSGEVDVSSVVARDTLAAGDVWHGAFVQRFGTVSLPEVIGFANEVSAERVRHIGPRSWVGPVSAKWRWQKGMG